MFESNVFDAIGRGRGCICYLVISSGTSEIIVIIFTLSWSKNRGGVVGLGRITLFLGKNAVTGDGWHYKLWWYYEIELLVKLEVFTLCNMGIDSNVYIIISYLEIWNSKLFKIWWWWRNRRREVRSFIEWSWLEAMYQRNSTNLFVDFSSYSILPAISGRQLWCGRSWI